MILACRSGIDHFVTDTVIDVGDAMVKPENSMRDFVLPVFVKVCEPQVTVKSSGTPS